MITPLFVISVTKNSVKIEYVIIVICLVSLGALLMKLQLKYKVPKFFPVVFHNLSGYDSHLFIKTLENSKGDISCIPIIKKTTFLSRNRLSLTNL